MEAGTIQSEWPVKITDSFDLERRNILTHMI